MQLNDIKVGIDLSTVLFFFFLILSVIATVSASDGRETPASLSHQGHDGNSRGQWAHYDPAYWGPEAWWGCYPSPTPAGLGNSEQYWDPYSAMYAYMAEVNAAYGFTPIPYPSVYCSHPFALPRSVRYPHGGSSDSDECSGYSSTDEMTYYGANCAHAMVPMMNGQGGVPMSLYGMPPPPLDTPSIVVTQTPNTEGSLEKINVSDSLKAENANGKEVKLEAVKSPQHEASIPQSPCSVDLDAYETAESDKCSDNEGATTDSDTEVEEEEEEEKDHKGGFGSGQLHTVCSVSDINLHKNEMGSDMHNSEEETDDDGEEEEAKGHFTDVQECLPYQLSIIYEESEQSDAESVNRGNMAGGRCPTRTNSSVTTSEDGDSSTTLDNGDDDSDGDYDIVDGESSTVSVRLPLKLKFSRSENDEEVTTVIVGDSQVRRHEVAGTAATTVTEEDEHVKKQEKNPKQEVRQNAVMVEKEEGSCTDISVTLCFPSKPNLSKRVEEWRRDTSQYARDNSINMSSDNMIPYSNSLSKKSNKDTAKKRPKTASDALQQVVMDEADAYETAESDSDVSVCLSLPLRRQSQRGSGFDSINNISEEEDEEDGKASSHCEDDSSSTTSIQTVRLTSGSQGRSSGSEMEAAVTADEGDENTVHKSDNSNASVQKCVNESENVVEDNKASSKKQIENKVSENEEDDDDEDSSESSKTSTSSRSCVSSKEVYSKKGRNNSVASSFNENAANEMKVDNEDNDSEESDDSQDGKEHDIIQKIYDMCTESGKVSQSDIKQRNLTGSKDKMLECNGEQSAANATKKLGRNEKQQSSKSQEESEEDDSGVTSDLSRQISDADTESEASRGEQSRMLKCQRASTHSRLFKLLQDECGKSDDEVEEGAAMKSRREHLTLPLCNTNGSDPDSLSSSSGVTSPASPTVTDRLVKELVQSLLQRKKGRRLKKLPLAKLHAAALRILQEDMDPYDTGSSEDSPSNHAYLLSTHGQGPHHSSNTANYPLPPQQVTYGDNYYDYCNYYDSWASATSYYGNNACSGFEYDIMPSRAFKLLSEHAQPGGFSSGIINGLWAKCPRMPSSKNVHKYLKNNSDQTDPDTRSYPSPPSQPAPASARTT